MPPYSSVLHDRTYSYKDTIFYGFVVSPLPIGNTAVYFIFLYFNSLYVSTVMPSYIIFDSGLPIPQIWPDIWNWRINAFLSSIVLSIMTLTSVLFCVYGIVTGNGTGSTSGVLGTSFALCVTIIYRLNFSPQIPLTKALLLVIIEALFDCRNGHDNMVLKAEPSLRARETLTGCQFTTKRFL